MTEVIELTETWATIEATEAVRERRRRRQQSALARRRRGGFDRTEAGCGRVFQPGRPVGTEDVVPVFEPGGEGWEALSARWPETTPEAFRFPLSDQPRGPGAWSSIHPLRRGPPPGPALTAALKQAAMTFGEATEAGYRGGPGPPGG
jgi:hypothetical protein